MGHHITPWWFTYTFDNPLRRLIHKPEIILGDYVREGMTVADFGSGFGFFSIGMAKLVGPKGRVWSVDIQKESLAKLEQRAGKAGVMDRITTVLTPPDRIDLDVTLDFALAFWMLHETPDPEVFLSEVHRLLRPGGMLLVTEPSGHVTDAMMQDEIDAADRQGFQSEPPQAITLSRVALFRKPA